MYSDLFFLLQTHPILSRYLHDHSYEYKKLYRDFSYWEILEEKAKQLYRLRVVDQLDDWEKKIRLLRTFLDVMN